VTFARARGFGDESRLRTAVTVRVTGTSFPDERFGREILPSAVCPRFSGARIFSWAHWVLATAASPGHAEHPASGSARKDPS
jgi:hypothetical protein